MAKINIKECLNAEFKSRKLTISKVAKECRIPKSVLHGWVNGTIPSAKNLHHVKSLCEYLEISVEQILFGGISKPRERTTLFESTFLDGDKQYRLTIEKLGVVK